MSTRLLFVIAQGKSDDDRGLNLESKGRLVTIQHWIKSYKGLFQTSRILSSTSEDAIRSSEMLGKVFGSPIIAKEILMERDGALPSLQDISELVAKNHDVGALILMLDQETASIFPIHYGEFHGMRDFPERAFNPGEGCLITDSKTCQFLG